MAAQGAVLPVGAIDVADPRDVLKTTTSSRRRPVSAKSISSGGLNPPRASGSGVAEQTDSGTPERGRYEPANTSSSPASSSGTQHSLRDSDVVGASIGCRMSKKKTENDHKGRKSTKQRRYERQQKQQDDYDEQRVRTANSPENVPMEIMDLRSEVEKLVDGLIDGRPALRDLTAFEAGSVLDYIDMIGLTREEVFREFPVGKPELPSVPGCKRLEILDDMQRGQTMEGAVLSPDEVINSLAEREQHLAKALDLECRRADLLECQVKMLRSELVIALKRWKMMTVALWPGINCGCLSDEQKRAAYLERLRSLDRVEAMSAGKFVRLQAEDAKVLDSFRNRHRKVQRRDTVASGEDCDSEEDSSGCLSSGSSPIWSSSSEGDDQ